MDVLKLLTRDSYIVLNRTLISELGIEETVFLSELIYEYNYWNNSGNLEDGWFYSTITNIEERIGYSGYKQRNIINKLKDMNVLFVELRGLERQRFFKINIAKLEQILDIKPDESLELSDTDKQILAQVMLEKDVDKSLELALKDYLLMLKQTKSFEINLKNIRGLLKSLKSFKCSNKDKLYIIQEATIKKWKSFYSNKFKSE